MATDVIVYFDPNIIGGLGDGSSPENAYSSLFAAWSAVSGRDLVAEDIIVKLECCSTSTAVEEAFSILSIRESEGAVTDSSHYFILKGNSFYTLKTSANYISLIFIGLEGTKLEDLNLRVEADAISTKVLSVNYNVIQLDRCTLYGGDVARNTGIDIGYQGNSGCILNNTTISTCSTGINCWTNGDQSIANHCAIIGCDKGVYVRDYHDFIMTNSYVGNCNNNIYLGYKTNLTLTSCATDDGSEGTLMVPYTTDNFTNVTAGTEDFHLPTGSLLIGAGTAISGLTEDADGETWGDPPSIGIYEYIQSGTAYNVTCTDGITATDAETVTLTIATLCQEISNFSDSNLKTIDINVSCTDSATMTDSATKTIVIDVSCNDGVQLTDSATATAIINAVLQDSGLFTDISISNTGGATGLVTITATSAKLNIIFNVVSKPQIIGG